ncbi:MAG: zinc-ribbon domain-containing protein [Rickettsiales bacterium]|nr:zinc-ribbon domain-containing protein [Rickettsiales bacterium]
MYITCPGCETRFTVTAEQIGKNGRKVKCSKCFHIWHQKPLGQVKIEPKVELVSTKTPPLGNGINLPVLLPIKVPGHLLYGLPILLISMIIFMVTILFQDSFVLPSILNNQNLVISDVRPYQHLDKTIINYKVTNLSSKSVKVPLIRIRIFDKNNRIISSRIENHNNIKLAPSENIILSTELVNIPPHANIDIMIGNKLDFILH